MYDVIIIGAGPSGIMSAIQLQNTSLKVLILEKNNKPLKKLELTGGGRCNLTNLKHNNELVKHIRNGDFFLSSLSNFNSKDIVNFFEKRNVKLKEEENNRIFTSNNDSKLIIEALLKELKHEIKYNSEVINIEKKDLYEIHTKDSIYKTKNLVIATGGLSYPNTGSTGDGYKFAKKLDHKVTDLFAGETFLVPKQKIPLEGISIKSKVTYQDKEFIDNILFTHIGLSGPAIFNVCEYIARELNNNNVISIDFLPDINKQELFDNLNKTETKLEIKTWLRNYLPTRLADYLLGDLSSIKIASISNKNKEIIINKIKDYKIEILKTGPITSAVVTSGGIDLDSIDQNTLESKIHKGLYFCGEVLDLNGEIGGYNLTIAFSTGYTVGKSIIKKTIN